ncbi:hypothetical protein ZWY2020_030916 [Hordeum vulgare]|nr:hypothetical protein ZWY2020_030916 [Hordeum vulgare]
MPDSSGDAALQVPLQILQHRVRQVGKRTIAQALIEWSDSSAEDATWEDVEFLNYKFPRAPAWGQAGFQEGRNVNIVDKGERQPEDRSATLMTRGETLADPARRSDASRFEGARGPGERPARKTMRAQMECRPRLTPIV